MYRKYVKAPIVSEGIRLDTVITAANGSTVGSISYVSAGSASRYGYVYLSSNAFSANATMASLTDNDQWRDGTYYQLAAYTGSDNTYLKATGANTTISGGDFGGSISATGGSTSITGGSFQELPFVGRDIRLQKRERGL